MGPPAPPRNERAPRYGAVGNCRPPLHPAAQFESPGGYISLSRGSGTLLMVTRGTSGSCGTDTECRCLNPTMQASGSNWRMRKTSVPGMEPGETTDTHFTFEPVPK